MTILKIRHLYQDLKNPFLKEFFQHAKEVEKCLFPPAGTHAQHVRAQAALEVLCKELAEC